MFNKKLHFVQHDIQLLYIDDITKLSYNSAYTAEYYVLVLFSGHAEIKFPDRIYYMKPWDIFIANENENYTVELGGALTEHLQIRFQSKQFHEIDKDIDILKPFYLNKFKLYNKGSDDKYYTSAIENILRALELRSSRSFIIGSVLQLLCELYYTYEQESPPATKESNSNFTKIVSYIDAHLYEKLTLKSVAKHVFLSERCVTDNIRRICGESFHELIIEKRIDQAKKLVDGQFYSLSDIAPLCGFDTYSTFYRTYKKCCGISPTERREQLNAEKKENSST